VRLLLLFVSFDFISQKHTKTATQEQRPTDGGEQLGSICIYPESIQIYSMQKFKEGSGIRSKPWSGDHTGDQCRNLG